MEPALPAKLSGFIIYDQSTGKLFFDEDGDRDDAVLFATLTNRPTNLDSTEFVVI